LIQELLDVNPSLAGFGIARADGQLILVSNVPEGKPLPNLLTSPKSAQSFQELLQKKKMLIGRTYFLSLLQKWVIPIRIPIFNKEGKIAYVMTTGIDIHNDELPWKIKSKKSDIAVAIVRDDYYFTYVSDISENEYEAYYYDPVPQKALAQLDQKRLMTSNINTFDLIDRYNEKLLVVSHYNKSLHLLYATAIPYKTLYLELYQRLNLFLLGIVLFYIAAFIFYTITNKSDKLLKSKLRWIARHDKLTNLPNRYYLEETIVHWNKRYPHYSIFFLDLDNFKFINDNYGHPFGDRLLKLLAQRLQTLIQDHEHVIRQGGDEFIIISSRQSSEIKDFAEHILHVISEIVHIDKISLYPKISIGIAHYPQDGDTIHSLLSKADMALYQAKEGKFGYAEYSKALEEISKRRLDIELQLRGAVERNEFYVLLQPQIDAQSLRIIGVEALVRWKNRELGFIPPDQFISIAEEIGEIKALGEFVLKEACLMCLEIWRTIQTPCNLSVNASVEELLHDDYVDTILRIIDDLHFPKEKLLIEVTESLLIHDVDRAKQVLNRLRSEGIGVSLDDFGTGYSSLSMLNGLPVTELKIDQSFVRDILIDSQDLSLVKSIIALAKLFNLKTVAEGVEESGQAEALQNAGCSVLQGYYFAKPLQKEELIALIQKSYM